MDVETVVESLTVSVSAIDVTSLTFEESVSIVIEVSVDENNKTFVISVETRVLVLSVVRSAEYRPIELPLFVTTMSRVEIQMDRYTTAAPSELSNATLIGVATGGALIAAVMGGVVIFITKKPADEDAMDSDVEIDDLNETTVRSLRSRSQSGVERRDDSSDSSEYDESTSAAEGEVELGWSDHDLDVLYIAASDLEVDSGSGGEGWKINSGNSGIEEDSFDSESVLDLRDGEADLWA
jgi:hypothetical protein